MTTLPEKRCSRCGIVKDANQFYQKKCRGDGLDSQCKECHKKYQQANPIMRQTNKMVCGARQRAKDKQIAFDIDHAYIRSIAPSRCPIFNIELEWSVERGNGHITLPNSPSLDRIDPSKGYVKGNVWIISHRANSIKSNATHEELKLVTEAVGRAIVNSLDW